MVLLDILETEGADVVFAGNGQEAVYLVSGVNGQQFDAILMDIQMPVMDGYEATKRIRKLYPDIPVIGLAAHAMPEEKQHCLDAGMVVHLIKPVNTDELVNEIRRNLTGTDDNDQQGVNPVTHSTTEVINMTDEIIIDEAALQARYNGRQAMINKLIATFLSTHSGTTEKIREAIIARDFDTLHETAHTLKGMSGYLEAKKLFDISVRAQELTEKKSDDAIALCEEMVTALEDLQVVLSARDV